MVSHYVMLSEICALSQKILNEHLFFTVSVELIKSVRYKSVKPLKICIQIDSSSLTDYNEILPRSRYVHALGASVFKIFKKTKIRSPTVIRKIFLLKKWKLFGENAPFDSSSLSNLHSNRQGISTIKSRSYSATENEWEFVRFQRITSLETEFRMVHKGIKLELVDHRSYAPY